MKKKIIKKKILSKHLAIWTRRRAEPSDSKENAILLNLAHCSWL